MERELRNSAVLDPQLRGNDRPSRFFNPRAAPAGEIGGRSGIEQRNQVAPCCVGEAMLAQVLLQSFLKRRLADDCLQLPHDDRRLLIDDCAVERAGFVEVVETLSNGVRAGCAIDVVGGRVMRQQEPQVVIDLGKRGIDDLGRHEIGEHFLHPHIVEPPHGHEVAEPHVCRFVRDQAGTTEFLVLRGRWVEQQAGGVVENRAGVLHAAKLERRDEHKIELAPRVRNPRVAFEPRQRRGVQIEDGLAVARHLGGVGLAVQHPECAAAAFRGLDRESPGGKREEIR